MQSLWKSVFLVLLILGICSSAQAASFTGQVVSVSDGDTIIVLRPGKIQEKIRLSEVDCPEKAQPFGQAAKRFTLEAAAQKTVTVQVRTKDRYGRTVGEVMLPDGRSLNRELVRAGYAWWYRTYSTDSSLGRLEAEARAAGRGLWSDPDPVPPWEWRKGARKAQSAAQSPVAQASFLSGECGQKRFCKEMTSCAEALFYLRECGLASLDGDGDGVPCESLCR
jgi:endonuclease YncB( thermonuclease family)